MICLKSFMPGDYATLLRGFCAWLLNYSSITRTTKSKSSIILLYLSIYYYNFTIIEKMLWMINQQSAIVPFKKYQQKLVQESSISQKKIFLPKQRW